MPGAKEKPTTPGMEESSGEKEAQGHPVHAGVQACMRACVHVRVCVCVCARTYCMVSSYSEWIGRAALRRKTTSHANTCRSESHPIVIFDSSSARVCSQSRERSELLLPTDSTALFFVASIII